MNTIVFYILEINLYLVLFALAYALWFRSETFFKLNRIILLAMVAVAFGLPFLTLPSTIVPIGLSAVQLPVLEIGGQQLRDSNYSEMSGFQIVAILYIAGALFFAARFAMQLSATLLLIRSQPKPNASIDGLIEIVSPVAPASFFRYIFWNPEVPESERCIIRAHEAVHASEWHSLDIIFIRTAEIVCWFNPAVHYLRKAVEANHEFRADQVVANKRIDIYQYSNVLLGQAMGVSHKVIAHHFSKPNLLKTRIMMLHKKQSDKSALFKYLMLLPVLCISLIFNACSKDESASMEANPVKLSNNEDIKVNYVQGPIPGAGEKVPGTDYYQVVDVMPAYPGGEAALMAFLGEHIVYPPSAKSDGAEGMVFLEFIVNEDGSVSEIQQSALQKNLPNAPDMRLVEAAIAAVEKMPSWTPGAHQDEKVKVQYKLPVQFKLS